MKGLTRYGETGWEAMKQPNELLQLNSDCGNGGEWMSPKYCGVKRAKHGQCVR